MNGDLSIAAQPMPVDLAPSARRASSGPDLSQHARGVTRAPAGAASPMFVAAVGEHEEAARLKALLTAAHVQVSTHLDDTTGRFVLEVQSLATGEVVEQIPSEELLRLYATLRESLVDESAERGPEMATDLNLNSLTVDQSGRPSFSGLGTGIDFQGTIEKIIEAKRLPIDRIEQRITDNQAKVAALEDLRTFALGVKTAVEKLRGKVSFDRSGDIFEAKQAFATTSRADSQAPSAAENLAAITVTNAAQATSHSVEVQQIATAHKLASNSIIAGIDDPLGLAGSFQIDGQEITVAATDTLLGLRDRINAANAGDEPTGVTASIVSISATEQVLILTADATGTDGAITLADSGGSLLQGLGVIDGAGAFENELQTAQNAEDRGRRARHHDRAPGQHDRRRLHRRDPQPVQGRARHDDQARRRARPQPGQDRDRRLRRRLQRAAHLHQSAGADQRPRGRRDRRRHPRRDHRALGRPLDAGGRGRRRGRRHRSNSAVLAQIGITLQGPGQVSDPMLANTLEIDETKLDEALLNQTDAVRALFSFQMSSSSPDVVLAGFDGNTGFSAAGYTLNVAYAGGVIVSANINGAADGSNDGSVVVDGKVLKVVDGRRQGPAAAVRRHQFGKRHPARSVGRGRRQDLQCAREPGRRHQRAARQRGRQSGGPEPARPGAGRPPRGAARARARPSARAVRRDGDRAYDHEPAARQPAPADRRRVRQQGPQLGLAICGRAVAYWITAKRVPSLLLLPALLLRPPSKRISRLCTGWPSHWS